MKLYFKLWKWILKEWKIILCLCRDWPKTFDNNTISSIFFSEANALDYLILVAATALQFVGITKAECFLTFQLFETPNISGQIMNYEF
jgi:hypothetical protein